MLTRRSKFAPDGRAEARFFLKGQPPGCRLRGQIGLRRGLRLWDVGNSAIRAHLYRAPLS